MEAGAIDDAVRRAGGAAARMVGEPFVLHRPHGPLSPVRSGTARMRLPALFLPQRSTLPSHGHPTFQGVFDSAYARAGDYLVGAQFTYFVASRMPLEPVICLRATRLASFVRSPGQAAGGLGQYGGLVRTGTMALLGYWPVSVIEAGDGLDRAGLPADVSVGGWSVLLPPTPPVVLQPGDLMTDDLGRAGVVAAAELSERGWKLLVRQAVT
jgi:hypothetical protein